MKQSCKQCLVGPICQTPCDKLLKYVKTHSQLYDRRLSLLRCNCKADFYGMITHKIAVDICSECNGFRVLSPTRFKIK